MATQRTARSIAPGSTTIVALFGVLIATALLGGLFLALRQPAALPAPAPTGPALAPAPHAMPAERQFRDELAGAGGLDLLTAASGAQPYDAPRPSEAAIDAPTTRPNVAGRFFADELAGATSADLVSAASGAQPVDAIGQPSRVYDVPTAPPRASTGSRIFDAEIAAGAGPLDWSTPETPAAQPFSGPR